MNTIVFNGVTYTVHKRIEIFPNPDFNPATDEPEQYFSKRGSAYLAEIPVEIEVEDEGDIAHALCVALIQYVSANS